LVDQVCAALPGLIAERLADFVPDDAPEDVEITEPVRIVVSLPLADLLSGRFEGLQHVAMATAFPGPSSASSTAGRRAPAGPQRTPEHLRQTSFAHLTPHQDVLSQPMTLAEFIGRLYERGELGQFLALLPAGTLEAWYQSLMSPLGEVLSTRPGAEAFPARPGDRLPDGTSHPTAHLPDQLSGVTAAQETGRSRQLREAISAIAARVSHGTISGAHPTDDPAPIFHHLPAPAAASSAGPRPHGAGAVAPALAAADTVSAGRANGTDPAAVVPAHVDSAPLATTDADVTCALPFLLLGPLAQTGYLTALEPALQPVGLQAHAAVFATALAYTVLGPLERAWRRRPADSAAAAAFAGLGAPLVGQALTEFARVAGTALPALDAVVTRALADGHTEGEPLVLVAAGERADHGLVLFDREGLFPVAWADAAAGLAPAWRMFGSPPVLVAPTAVGALRGLADAGASFVVATPPARTEPWRRLPPHRLWTNSDDPALARHAAGYRQATDLAAELIQALATERAAVPLAASPALARSLLLAAGLGLGTLAWTLWREREPTDPLLALERFADLSARVSFEPHRIRVRLPLGPRHSDLSAHGLLADVLGVPWFGDRVVEFSGG
jgi:hypothetical protein